MGGHTSENNRQQSHENSKHDTRQQPRNQPQNSRRTIQNEVQKVHFIRQIIDIADRSHNSNRNRPKDNQRNNKGRRSGKPSDSFGVTDPEIPPDDFGWFGREGAFEFEGDVVLLGKVDLGCFVGGGKAGEGDEGGGDFFGAHMVFLFLRDFGVHAGQLGARVIDAVDLKTQQ